MEPGLAAQYRYRPPPIVFSNAAHACVVEVDVSTGMVQILRWIASEDCGVQINPAIVEGQVAGGVAQAIGGVLMEEIRHDENGNPTTVTFKDYLIPTIHDVPVLEFCHLETPAENEGGFKGVGEGGAIIGPPTLVNAIADALSPFGVRCLDLPLSPARIIALLDNQKGEKP
jgi:carbon-monoxide dehydrogenase large subunit